MGKLGNNLSLPPRSYLVSWLFDLKKKKKKTRALRLT